MRQIGFCVSNRMVTEISVEGPFEGLALRDQIRASTLIKIEGRSDPYHMQVTIYGLEDGRLPGTSDHLDRGDQEREKARGLIALWWLVKCQTKGFESERVLVVRIPERPEATKRWTIEEVENFVSHELAEYDIESRKSRWQARQKYKDSD